DDALASLVLARHAPLGEGEDRPELVEVLLHPLREKGIFPRPARHEAIAPSHGVDVCRGREPRTDHREPDPVERLGVGPDVYAREQLPQLREPAMRGEARDARETKRRSQLVERTLESIPTL